MIVKVQLPIAGANIGALVYNEDRSYLEYVEITSDLLKEMKGDLRTFWESELDDDGELILNKRLPEQGW